MGGASASMALYIRYTVTVRTYARLLVSLFSLRFEWLCTGFLALAQEPWIQWRWMRNSPHALRLKTAFQLAPAALLRKESTPAGGPIPVEAPHVQPEHRRCSHASAGPGVNQWHRCQSDGRCSRRDCRQWSESACARCSARSGGVTGQVPDSNRRRSRTTAHRSSRQLPHLLLPPGRRARRHLSQNHTTNVEMLWSRRYL